MSTPTTTRTANKRSRPFTDVISPTAASPSWRTSVLSRPLVRPEKRCRTEQSTNDISSILQRTRVQSDSVFRSSSATNWTSVMDQVDCKRRKHSSETMSCRSSDDDDDDSGEGSSKYTKDQVMAMIQQAVLLREQDLRQEYDSILQQKLCEQFNFILICR